MSGLTLFLLYRPAICPKLTRYDRNLSVSAKGDLIPGEISAKAALFF